MHPPLSSPLLGVHHRLPPSLTLGQIMQPGTYLFHSWHFQFLFIWRLPELALFAMVYRLCLQIPVWLLPT